MILLIDDDLDLAELYKEVLDLEGLDTHVEDQIDHALLYIKQNFELIRLVILDIMMAPQDVFTTESTEDGLSTGILLYNEIRNLIGPKIPVMVLTNREDAKARDFFKEKSNCYFYTKRVMDVHLLTETVQDLIKRVVNE